MLKQNNYGKSHIRLIKVARGSRVHQLQHLAVEITFEGDFEEVYTAGDNSRVLPTDTMKNTVYAFANQTDVIEQVEAFGVRLADHFLSHNPPVAKVKIDLSEHRWSRILVNDEPHDHSFRKDGDEKRTAFIIADREGVKVKAGIKDMVVLKTTRSGFAGFVKDQYTSLPETDERIFATSVKAIWTYDEPRAATDKTWSGVRRTILEEFALHDSRSVQHTLNKMGEAVLEKYSDINEIFLSLPNIHCIPVDLEKFDLINEGRVFVPTEEPFGLIEAHLTR